MYYKNITQNLRIAYLFKYLSKKNKGDKDFSIDFIQNFSKGNKLAIDMVFDKLYPLLDDNFTLALVPTVEAGINPYRSSCYELCRKIIEQAKRDNKNINDGTKTLIAERKDKHSFLSFFKSNSKVEILVSDPQIIMGQDVLLIADVAKKGTYLEECCQKLLQNGAKSVAVFVVGIQVDDKHKYSSTNIILNLDKTLFDIEKKSAISHDYTSDAQIFKLINALNIIAHKEIFFMTEMDRPYMELLFEKLKLDTKNLLTVDKDYESLWNVRQLYANNRPAIIAISDEENFLTCAQEIGFTTVLLDLNSDNNTHDKYTDFSFSTIEEIKENIEAVYRDSTKSIKYYI